MTRRLFWSHKVQHLSPINSQKDFMIVEPGKSTSKKIVVQTRLGNDLDNEQIWDDIPEILKKRFAEDYNSYLSDQHTREINKESQVYNCHGLTFGSRRAMLSEVDKILKEDFFEEVDFHATHEGDVAIYLEDKGVVHSGMVVGKIEGTSRRLDIPLVLSKWGMYGEYVHKFNCCPYMPQSKKVIFYRVNNEKRYQPNTA